MISEMTPKTKQTIAVHLVGHLDVEAGDSVSAQIWKMTEDGDPKIVVHAEQLRLSNFSGFRALAESIHSLRELGRDVTIVSSSPQVLAVLADLKLDSACAFSTARADRHVLIGSPAGYGRSRAGISASAVA